MTCEHFPPKISARVRRNEEQGLFCEDEVGEHRADTVMRADSRSAQIRSRLSAKVNKALMTSALSTETQCFGWIDLGTEAKTDYTFPYFVPFSSTCGNLQAFPRFYNKLRYRFYPRAQEHP